MKQIKGREFSEERALFGAKNVVVSECIIKTGESPFKHSGGIIFENSTVSSKYPFWYSEDVRIKGCVFEPGARAGIWYSKDVLVGDTKVLSPKMFRRCEDVELDGVSIPDAQETLWSCSDVKARNLKASNADYMFMNSSGIEIEGMTLDGKYVFDGASDVVIRNAKIETKDAFWNSKNVAVYDSVISSEYIGWNSENITFVRCTIESLQGFCYINGLKLVDCRLPGTTLAFEYSTVDAEVKGGIESVLDPAGGNIKADSIKTLTVRDKYVDPDATKIDAAVERITEEPEF
ncbi:MAG: DUF3737 family protein [Clostridia bacterium]|nr:DUF3737 family protein [Clostridia bacterium]